MIVCAGWISKYASKCWKPIGTARNVQAIVLRGRAPGNLRNCVGRVLKEEDVECLMYNMNYSVPKLNVLWPLCYAPGLVSSMMTPTLGEDERDKYCIR